MNPLREDAGLRPIPFAPAPQFTTEGPIGSDPPNQLLEDGVRGYNGFNGALTLAGVVIRGARGGAVLLHEFRPDEEFLATVPDSEIAGLNNDSRVWRRVPLNERPPRPGEPNYVALVAANSPECEP